MPALFRSRQSSTFHDRTDAGAQLADVIQTRLPIDNPDDVVAVGLARGGVIVAAEVARKLGIRLEAIVIRKLGAPDQPELAVGALSASGERVLNERLISDIGIGEPQLARITDRATTAALQLCEEIDAPAQVPDIEGKTVLLIDDGLATGATMRVAVHAARAQAAASVIVAVPVAPDSSIASFQAIADDVIAVLTPPDLRAVGQWYEIFMDVPSHEVRRTLDADRERRNHGT